MIRLSSSGQCPGGRGGKGGPCGGGDGGIIITSLGFEEVDSRRSRGSNLLIELSEDPKPESEVADAIITSVSLVALLLSVVSMMD